MALVLFAGMTLTVVLTVLTPPKYESHSKLFVSTSFGAQTDLLASAFISQRVNSYADLAVEPSVTQKVIDRLGLDMSAGQLSAASSASVVPDTRTIALSVTASSPEEAQQIAEALSDEVIALIARLEAQESTNGVPAVITRVAAAPSFSALPVSPNVPLNVAVGLILSLLAGIAGALLRDLLDRTIKSRQDIEKLIGANILATLPFDAAVRQSPLVSETAGPLAEAFRVLRTSLQFTSLDSQRQAILVSSAVPEEGKTLTAVNLALSMGQSGRSVLLIDCDMRNPSCAERLGLENSVGLVTVLIGRTTLEGAIQVHPSGVEFLGTGPQPPNPAEILDTQAVRELLREVRERYDVVILDAPPLLPVADASILQSEVDGTLLLARYGTTSHGQLRLAASRIETVGGRLLGIVLNRTPGTDIGKYGYGYGYGHGRSAQPEPRRTFRQVFGSRRT